MRIATTVITAALLLGVAACSDDDPQAGDAPDTPTTTAATEETPVPIAERRPFGVGAHTEFLVDDSRTTPAFAGKGLEEQPDRTLGLIVLYPTDDDGLPAELAERQNTGIVDGTAPPADTDTPVADGTFPLLVFAHGWNGSGASLIGPATRWAEQGYIVALPTFPLSHEGIATDTDMINQPGDMSYVIDTLLAAKGDDSYLADHIDADRIAVGGHSLGSATVFGFQNSCCKDPRVKAIVAISGGPSAYSTGEYDTELSTPMLLVHGAKDPGVNPGISEAVFGGFPGKMSFLLFAEGTHTSHFGGEDGALLDKVVVAYLDEELGVVPGAFDGIEAEVAASGRATLRSKAE